MKNKGIIRIAVKFDSPVQSQEEVSFAILKAFVKWTRDEIFVRRLSKGAEIPFEFDDEDKED